MNRPAPPVWRSILYVPGNVPKFIDKAHERGADCILVDLEDSVTAATTEPEAVIYTVRKGDTMWAIFEANRPMLKHPDKIYPGQALRIPPEPEGKS